jgi:Tol biopolymer transport system component
MPAKSSLPLILALVVSAACTTSTEGSPTGAASAPPPPSGTIVFNRGTWPDIAVYSLDLGAGTEHKIRDVEDFVTMSPDGRRFVDIAWKADGSTTPATFDIDGSGYTVLKFADPTFGMAVGSGGWSPDGKRFFGGGGDATDPSRDGLYTVRVADGGGLVRLTESRHDYAVGYSPDGSHALFISAVKPYGHSGPMDVFVVGTDGEGLVRLNPPGTTSGLDGQSWSPDGRQVAFVAAKGSFWDDDRAVFVADADGTDVRRITPWNVTYRAEWAPDGEWIAYDFDSSGSELHDLFVVHPDGTERTQVTSNEDGKMSFAPTWSPDSRTLLLVRRELEDEPELWTVNVDGTGLLQVTHSPAEYTGYRWLPSPSVSNGEVVMARGLSWSPDAEPTLVAMDPETGDVRTLFTCDQECYMSDTAWSSDGEELVFSSGGSLYVLDVGTGSARPLASVKAEGPVFSPDGERIAYQAVKKWPLGFFVIGRDGTGAMTLDVLKGRPLLWYAWLPDRESIAYYEQSGFESGGGSIGVVDVDGPQSDRTLVSLPLSDACVEPHGSPTQSCEHAIAMSPADGRIAYATYEPTTETELIRLVEASDGRVTPLAPWTGPRIESMAWSPDGEHIAMAAGCEVWSMHSDGTDRALIDDLGSCIRIGSLTWSPDGTELAFVEIGPPQGGDLLMVTLTVLAVDSGSVIARADLTHDVYGGIPPIAWQPVP